MNLSIIYFGFIFFLLLLLTNSTELINQCPTARRLLLFSSLKLPFGEKKTPSRHVSRSITYIQPQTSQELGKKIRSYTHLLKPKLFTNEEKSQLKRLQKIEKKKITTKKKDTIEHTKTKDLIVPINREEIDRCRSLLEIDEKKSKKTKRDVSTTSKVKNATNQSIKNVKKKADIVPTTASKVKSTKKILKTPNKPPINPSTENLKYKPSKPETITIIEQIRSPFDEQNNSAVNRAFYFVKNMFQLSEQSSEESQLEDDQIINLNNEQQTTQHHHSRKLLNIDEYQYVPKRQLLSTKSKLPTKQKSKTNNLKNENKPKVGWAYRYRISRYLEAQKSKHKRTEREKKSNQSRTKRKLLQFDSEEEEDLDSNEISDQNIINTVAIMSNFVPKRQLLTTKSKNKNNNNIDVEKKKKTKHIDPIAILPSHEEGSQKPHVGWEFRYRVSKYMDSLRESIDADQQRLKSDLQTMKQKRKVNKSSVSETIEKEKLQIQQESDLDPELAQINEEGRKVGWAYRYRIRRKLDHLKSIQAETGVPFDLATLSGKREKKINATKNKTKTIPKKKNETVPVPPPEEDKKAVGWEYRYRVRRKLDALQQTASINQSGKRTKNIKKKSRQNTDNRSIMTFFSTLFSTAKQSVCFLPVSSSLSFCSSDLKESVVPKKSKRVKKLRTKKEYRAKQFIRGHHTKLGAEDKATERRVDEQMKRLYKKPSYPPLQVPPPPPPLTVENAAYSAKSNEHIERIIAVDSKKNQNKKKNQIIGQKITVKPKHSQSSTKQTTTTIPVTTQIPLTTASVPLRTLSEFIKEEAATILKSDRKESQTPEEIQDEVNETQEIIREQKLLKATTANKSTSSNDTPDHIQN